MENFQEEIGLIKTILRRIIKAKSLAAIIVVSLLAIFVAIFYWKNSDFITKVNFTISNDQQNILGPSKEKDNSSDRKKYNNLNFGQIYLPPKSNTLPSIIVFEIKNTGDTLLSNIHVMLDMGSIKAIKYEIVGGEIVLSNSGDKNNSIINFDIKKLHSKNSFYLHVMAEFPLFKRIVINADNLDGPKEINYESYILDNRNTGFWKWQNLWIIFLVSPIFLGIFFLILFIIKVCTLELLGSCENKKINSDKKNDPHAKND